MAAESSGDLNQRIALGQFTILIQVQDYNGGANDTNVLVGVLTGSNLGAVPKWDGTDTWPVDPASALGDVPYDGGYSWAPSTGTGSAWVNNYQLVAHLPPLTVGMGLGPITFTGGILSATISQDSAGQYSLVGQLAGRLTTHTLFAYAGHSGYYDDAGKIHKLCGTDPKFVMLQSSLCAEADIMGDPTLDSTDAGCNALSFALGFTTAPVQLGAPLASHYPSVGCDGSVTDCTP